MSATQRATSDRARVRRWVAVATCATVLAAGAATAWMAHSGAKVRDELAAARGHLETARRRAFAGDLDAAGREIRRAQVRTGRARSIASGPVWRLAGAVPWLGDTPKSVTVASRQADVLARDVFPQLLDVAHRLAPRRLRPTTDRVNLATVQQLAPSIARAQVGMRESRDALATALSGWVLDLVEHPVRDFRGQLDHLAATVDSLARVTRLLPPMLGATESRRYFLAFQNPAESRGTGGLVGAYGILETDRGRLRVAELGTDDDLKALSALPVDLGEDYHHLYGPDPALWVNSNESPHFPYAAQIWLAAWEKTRGERLDGVLALDPVVLSYVLDVEGPITLDGGERITADNVVDKTLRESYERFPDDVRARKRYLLDVAAAVVEELLADPGDPLDLIGALARGASERRVLLYSAHPEEQLELLPSKLAGALPSGQGPWAMLTVNNAGGSKLDYYLERTVSYLGRSCSLGDSRRETSVHVRLRNDVTAGQRLPDYVVGVAAALPPKGRQRNDHRAFVALYASPDALIEDVRLDGRAVKFRQGTEQGHPVTLITLDLPAGRTREIAYRLSEPATDEQPRLEEQPLVRAQRSLLDAPPCRRP